jgi:hypothetical protein
VGGGDIDASPEVLAAARRRSSALALMGRRGSSAKLSDPPKQMPELKRAERAWLEAHKGERCMDMRYIVRFKLRAERWIDLGFVVATTIVYGVLSWVLLITDTLDERGRQSAE